MCSQTLTELVFFRMSLQEVFGRRKDKPALVYTQVIVFDGDEAESDLQKWKERMQLVFGQSFSGIRKFYCLFILFFNLVYGFRKDELLLDRSICPIHSANSLPGSLFVRRGGTSTLWKQHSFRDAVKKRKRSKHRGVLRCLYWRTSSCQMGRIFGVFAYASSSLFLQSGLGIEVALLCDSRISYLAAFLFMHLLWGGKEGSVQACAVDYEEARNRSISEARWSWCIGKKKKKRKTC